MDGLKVTTKYLGRDSNRALPEYCHSCVAERKRLYHAIGNGERGRVVGVHTRSLPSYRLASVCLQTVRSEVLTAATEERCPYGCIIC
jgi:hypothetical protein